MAVVRDNLDDLYRNNFKFIKGSEFYINLIMDKPIDQYYVRNLGAILNHWTFPFEDKDYRPFRLREINFESTSFKAKLIHKSKHKEIDEIRLLCKDLIDVFNYDKVHILSINIEE